MSQIKAIFLALITLSFLSAPAFASNLGTYEKSEINFNGLIKQLEKREKRLAKRMKVKTNKPAAKTGKASAKSKPGAKKKISKGGPRAVADNRTFHFDEDMTVRMSKPESKSPVGAVGATAGAGATGAGAGAGGASGAEGAGATGAGAASSGVRAKSGGSTPAREVSSSRKTAVADANSYTIQLVNKPGTAARMTPRSARD